MNYRHTHVSSHALGIRPARFEDVPHLARLLARAFYDDPVYQWLLPEASTRVQRSERIFKGFLHTLYPCKSALVTSKLDGVALWLPPSSCHISWVNQAKQNFRIISALGRYAHRGLLWWWFLERHHPPYRHWTLFLLGVEPEQQGKGIGTALVQYMLERIDRESVPVYLDTGNPGNARFYQRIGFEAIRTVHLPGGPTIVQMIRPSRGQESEALLLGMR